MTIKFHADYTVGTPPESFSAGDVVEGRSAESEAHFVRRGKALYLNEETGELTDMDGVVRGKHDAKAKGKAAAAVEPKVELEPQPLRASAEPPPGSVLTSLDARHSSPAEVVQATEAKAAPKAKAAKAAPGGDA